MSTLHNSNNSKHVLHTSFIALIASLGGFLMGFDASVISGVVGFIEPEFNLTKLQLGWAVASLSLTAAIAMLLSGPISDRLGRKALLKIAAILFLVSAIASALANDFYTLVIARMIGGFGVGAALIVAPMYIAEIAPAEKRGRMVSLNQLNIVIGLSVAFFSNYAIVALAKSDAQWVSFLKFDEWNWRWMLGIEALPALLYFLCLLMVPESPRWLFMKGRTQEAKDLLARICGEHGAEKELTEIEQSLSSQPLNQTSFRELLNPKLRLVLVIGLTIAVMQQISGINAVFFYAPVIFEQSGLGTDASLMQAIWVGLVNLVFTLVAISLIDRLGRRALLLVGASGVAFFLFLLAYGFSMASYSLDANMLQALPSEQMQQLQGLTGQVFSSESELRAAITVGVGDADIDINSLVRAATQVDQGLILFAILGFVACFAVSLGPIMWVLFSELFPNRIRGIAISFVGLVNSAVSFVVQLLFPWQLANLGAATTFLCFAIGVIIGLVLMAMYLPETKGKSLEELENTLSSS